MIRLHDKDGFEYPFRISGFPDGTHQVWDITPEPPKQEAMVVTWEFENEAELFHVCQLGVLLFKAYNTFPSLVVPKLPYRYMDYNVCNSKPFALEVFIRMIIESGYTRIITYEEHKPNAFIQFRKGDI